MCELLGRFKRKLEQELTKFKLELEADNAGVTAAIEARVEANEIERNR